MCYDILYDDNGISVLITNSWCVCFLYSDNLFSVCIFQWLLRKQILQESVCQDRLDHTTVLGVVSNLWVQADCQMVPTVLLLLPVVFVF